MDMMAPHQEPKRLYNGACTVCHGAGAKGNNPCTSCGGLGSQCAQAMIEAIQENRQFSRLKPDHPAVNFPIFI